MKAEHTEEKARKRLTNIKLADESTRTCTRKICVTNYEPGHLWYAYGHYPSTKPYTPGDQDRKLLADYARHGVKIIKIHWEWADPINGLYTPYSEKGWGDFVSMVHSEGMKIIPYFSMGWLDIRDKNYKKEWGKGASLAEYFYYKLEHCCPFSPGWRAYLLSRIEEAFEKWQVDGIYIDSGLFEEECLNPETHIHVFKDTKERFTSHEDILAEVYGVVKRHNGIIVLFDGELNYESHKCLSSYYDYFVIGESFDDLDEIRNRYLNCKPYGLLIPDWSILPASKVKAIYAYSIPYLWFPVLTGGSFGEKEDPRSVPGIEWKEGGLGGYYPERQIIRDESMQLWYKYLSVYRRMTKDGTIVFIETGVSGFIKDGGGYLPGVVRTIFANDELYFAIANYRKDNIQVELASPFREMISDKVVQSVALEPDSLVILQKVG